MKWRLPVTWPSRLNEKQTFDQKKLPGGSYAMAFQITDVFGRRYMSDVFSVKWDGHTAQFACGLGNTAQMNP